MSAPTVPPPTATELDASRARAAALEASGWGHPVRLVAPRNLAFWVLALFTGLGVFPFVALLANGTAVDTGAVVVSLVVFALFGVLIWWVVSALDRTVPVPIPLRVLAVAWGALGATLAIAVAGDTALLTLLSRAVGPLWAADWGAGVTAPLIEELTKGAGVLLLLVLAPRVLRTAFDGFVVGASVGLGFEVVEDLGYALNGARTQFGADAVGASAEVIIVRVVTGVMSHTLMTALFGAGLVWFLGTRAEIRRRGRGLALMLAALVLHGTWDASSALARVVFGLEDAAPVAVLIVVAGAAAAAVTYRLAVPHERAILRDVLAPEVATGALGAPELAVLAGGHRARHRFRRAGTDRADRRLRRHRLAAAHVLADEIARAGGQETDRVRAARGELARFAGG